MNLHRLLLERNKDNNPIKVGLIGAGKFGTMFLSQARTTTGIHIVGIADLNVEQAKKNCLKAGWKQEKFEADSYEEALAKGKTFIGEDSERLIKTGIFAYTRNPIYFSFVLFHLSMFLVFENVMYFLSAAGLAIWLHNYVIKSEENYLLSIFPDEYDRYMKAVRRWIFF